MMCARCEELEERVAWLESELNLRRDTHQFAKVRDAMRATFKGAAVIKKPSLGQPAEMVLELYRAKGAPVTFYQLLERIPGPNGEERDVNIVKVWACRARATLGKDIIGNVWGRGYRLTDVGMQRVKEILDAA